MRSADVLGGVVRDHGGRGDQDDRQPHPRLHPRPQPAQQHRGAHPAEIDPRLGRDQLVVDEAQPPRWRSRRTPAPRTPTASAPARAAERSRSPRPRPTAARRPAGPRRPAAQCRQHPPPQRSRSGHQAPRPHTTARPDPSAQRRAEAAGTRPTKVGRRSVLEAPAQVREVAGQSGGPEQGWDDDHDQDKEHSAEQGTRPHGLHVGPNDGAREHKQERRRHEVPAPRHEACVDNQPEESAPYAPPPRLRPSPRTARVPQDVLSAEVTVCTSSWAGSGTTQRAHDCARTRDPFHCHDTEPYENTSHSVGESARDRVCRRAGRHFCRPKVRVDQYVALRFNSLRTKLLMPRDTRLPRLRHFGRVSSQRRVRIPGKLRRMREGAYEDLVTRGLAATVDELVDLEAEVAKVDPADQAHVLTHHLANALVAPARGGT